MGIRLCIVLLLCTHLFAHKIEGLTLVMTPLENDVVAIEGKIKGPGKKLEGNKIALISMIDHRVLFEDFLEGGKPLHVKIPHESYWVYLYVGDQDVVEEGIAPKAGFLKLAPSQKERAYRTMLMVSCGLIALFLGISVYRIYHYKKRRKSFNI